MFLFMGIIDSDKTVYTLLQVVEQQITNIKPIAFGCMTYHISK